MKRALLLICVLFSAIYVSAQTFPKKADRIIIETQQTNVESAMLQAAGKLLDEKIVIDVIDYKLGYITTKVFNERSNLFQKFLLRFSSENGYIAITLSGQYIIGAYEKDETSLGWTHIDNSGIKGSFQQIAWNSLVAKAKTFGTISAGNQPEEISK